MTAAWESTSMRDHVDLIAEGGDRTLTWMGRFCWKNPLDMMIYQEIVHEVRPTLVVETGTHSGGSALFWRDMMRLADGRGEVISVDINAATPLDLDALDGVTFVSGSSIAPAIVDAVAYTVARHARVLVNLDSDHAYHHVRDELDAYHGFVTPGSYLIVEDGIDDYRHDRRGPHAATVDWLADHPEFEIDKGRERLGVTNCPDGFLRRR